VSRPVVFHSLLIRSRSGNLCEINVGEDEYMTQSVAFASGTDTPAPGMLQETPMEATMRRIPRDEWIEWLDGLVISGEVWVVSDDQPRSDTAGWTFRSADFDPFDDVVEIILDDDRGRVRILLESPSEILAVGNDTNPDHLTFIAPDGPLVITRSPAPVERPVRLSVPEVV
jgi:hypothetical protein